MKPVSLIWNPFKTRVDENSSLENLVSLFLCLISFCFCEFLYLHNVIIRCIFDKTKTKHKYDILNTLQIRSQFNSFVFLWICKLTYSKDYFHCVELIQLFNKLARITSHFISICWGSVQDLSRWEFNFNV